MEPELSVTRWRSFGKDRLYVNGPDGQRLGWYDLLTGALTVESAENDATVLDVVEHWRAAHTAVGQAPISSADRQPPPAAIPAGEAAAPAQHETPAPVGAGWTPEPDWEDLAGRHAGQAAREQAVALRKAAPVRTFVARVLRLHTDERAWRIGADGEQMVGAQLAKLLRKDQRWHVLHAVPVGDNGSDIDHVVIGPAGVFTLNAKHHPRARIWVGGNTFMVNGQRLPYVRNSRHEAQRAARLLTQHAGVPLRAVGVVVPVGAADVVVKQAPEGVRVIGRRQLVRWLRQEPELLDQDVVERVFDTARRSPTWHRPGPAEKSG